MTRACCPAFDGGLIEANAPPGAPVLLAFSGGADSTAALALLAAHCAAAGRRLFAAHLDHAIRAVSAADAAFCAEQCAARDIPLFVRRVDVPALAAGSGRSLEDAAREARYAFFAELMAEWHIPLLVTAHHADDNLETMLLRMVRGSGLRGLCGIPPARDFAGGRLVRPLLRATKADLTAYCTAMELAYVTDETNADLVYARNRIRSEVLPSLASLNPALLARTADLAEWLRADEAFLDDAAQQRYATLDAPDSAPAEWLRAQPDAMRPRLFHRLYRGGGGCGMLEGVHLRAIDRVLSSGRGEVALPGSMTARWVGERLCFTPAESAVRVDDFTSIARLGWQLLPAGDAVGWFPAGNSEKIACCDTNIYKLFINRQLNFDTIKGQPFWRNRRPGDEIVCRGHHRSVKKMLSSAHLSPALRQRLPVLCDETGIVWLPVVDCVRDGCGGGQDAAAVQIRMNGI